MHREFFDTTCQLLRNWESTKIPIITDREGGIVNAISQSLPTAQHVLGWNHLLQDAKYYVKAHGCEVDNVRDTVRNWMLCDSQEMHEAALKDKSSEWVARKFRAYFMKSVDPVAKEKLGRWTVGKYEAFDPYSGLITNQLEGFNTVMKVACIIPILM